MLKRIIEFSLKNKLIIVLMIIGLVGGGVYSAMQLPIDAVPDITNNQIMVITTSPSLGAPDVERFLTVPIEQSTQNIPGLIEQRSFSRFGLSLVTLVFSDNTDVYWARQQVSERLNQVREEIPQGMGSPEMGPVTTGLGEVYQYVVRALPGYEGKYDLRKLREIQDWVVRRQLLGTEGVADVSSFGGKLKQYEIAIRPEQLAAHHVSVSEICEALNLNNQNAGGAYVEKGPQAVFIRSEGLTQSLSDIGKIVIKNENGIPLLIRDVATVQIGNAIRYGAMTYNGGNEVSGAVVMMLKGANSRKVIANIKQKVAEIQTTLPKGVVIEPFLDRTKMVDGAINTVTHNLLEGALIVIFVLVLFLGNLRSGLIVASVIPLSMLFALIMMQLFHVSGNLMSLGALDFGMIVDGAVIIVEATVHELQKRMKEHKQMLSRPQMDGLVGKVSDHMMHSAAFGQMIILIVYLPIMSLEGIEGKMFRPMAETVIFAVLGAFFLSLTYIPVMSSFFLGKVGTLKPSFADKMISRLDIIYQRNLENALKHAKWIVISAFILLAVAIWGLTRLGGEFIPKIEEGDFAVSTTLLSGTSLTHTIETSNKAAHLLKKKFPEVEKVVLKIGSGEIPTDPMSMNEADMMVILKPQKEWTSATSFSELANKMSKALQVFPEIATGFSYPVQMRFNELMTGAKQDVVCKIFGDDLDTLSHYSDLLAQIVRKTDGASDLYKETLTGIGQMVIHYDRDALAQYGLNISTVNDVLRTAYAGTICGAVYENDRRFDIVVRMEGSQRNDINAIKNLLVTLPNGHQIPLSQVAQIEFKDAPYQILRENAHRRISVGFNVNNKDVQTVVESLQARVQKEMHLPAGYYITYGGSYKNLQHATDRLSIAVPIALVLIFLMLFFAFKDVKLCVVIFSAIPLSLIGGVVSLWIRGLPFSISAGVGFIALFGVAVLNGIVLIGEMEQLKLVGNLTVLQRIHQATSSRLRPVLMTACVASLGFLPMSISTSPGSEVQRPLATVVIGGLITATLLTLFVLPCLYLLMEKIRKVKSSSIAKTLTCVILLSAMSQYAHAQSSLSWQQALSLAQHNNLQLSAAQLAVKNSEMMKASAVDIPKTELLFGYGQINSKAMDNKVMISQQISLPIVYKRKANLLQDEWKQQMLQQKVTLAAVNRITSLGYLDWMYLNAKSALLFQMDSLYFQVNKIAALRLSQGESDLLEKSTLENEVHQMQLQINDVEKDQWLAKKRLAIWLNQDSIVSISDSLSDKFVPIDTSRYGDHPLLAVARKEQTLAHDRVDVAKSRLLPDLTFAYTNQSFVGWYANKNQQDSYYNPSNRFHSFEAGIALPIFNKAAKNDVKVAKMQEQIASSNYQLQSQQLQLSVASQYADFQKASNEVHYFKTSALQTADEMIHQAMLKYKNGEIDYLKWIIAMRNALDIKNQYVEALRRLQLSIIELNYTLYQND